MGFEQALKDIEKKVYNTFNKEIEILKKGCINHTTRIICGVLHKTL